MCGFAGWFSPVVTEEDARPRLAAMMRALRHRGPDGSRECFADQAALGHVRLSIIDPAGGQQPMTTHDGRVSIVFNGEIYNFRELRAGLLREGTRFQTQSDTEVILGLYEQYGPQGFGRLRGMYAFALWDHELRLGVLARDPCGIKPLFIQNGPGGTLRFASEAKGIFADPHHPGLALNEGALHLLMNFRYVPGEETLFRGISQLPPGTLLLWKANESLRFTDIEQEASVPADPSDAVRESVRRPPLRTSKLALTLSGGIDSALIAALARSASGAALKTFTLDIGDDPAEAANAARSAQLLQVLNHQFSLSDPIETALPRLIWHLEIPKVNALQVWRLARCTAREVKVVLSGLGGDELFFGYNAHRILWLYSVVNRAVPGSWRRVAGKAGAWLLQTLPGSMWSERERAFRMLAARGDWSRAYGLLRNVWDSPRLRRMVYGPRMLDSVLPDAFQVLERLWPAEVDPLMATAQFEWRHKMVNDLLWQEDRASMAEGLEVRVPFVDQPLRNAIWGLGRSRLMPHGKPKEYMRQLAAGVLPHEILNRPKSGFQVDSPTFFSEQLLPMARCWLSDERVQHYGLFNIKFVRQVTAMGSHTRYRWHYFMLYLMLATHIWLALFEERSCVA